MSSKNYISSSSKQKIRRHVSVLNVKADLELSVCEESCCIGKGSYVHCPLCNKDKYQPFSTQHIAQHVQLHHIKDAVKTQAWLLLVCNLHCGVLTSAHYHCPCGLLLKQKDKITDHLLNKCAFRSRGTKATEVSGQTNAEHPKTNVSSTNPTYVQSKASLYLQNLAKVEDKGSDSPQSNGNVKRDLGSEIARPVAWWNKATPVIYKGQSIWETQQCYKPNQQQRQRRKDILKAYPYAHISMVFDVTDFDIGRCGECCMQFHCPLCPAELFKPNNPKKVIDHINQTHIKSGVKFRDLDVLKCRLDCLPIRRKIGQTHYHCPMCPVKVSIPRRFQEHLHCHDKGTNKIHRRHRNGLESEAKKTLETELVQAEKDLEMSYQVIEGIDEAGNAVKIQIPIPAGCPQVFSPIEGIDESTDNTMPQLHQVSKGYQGDETNNPIDEVTEPTEIYAKNEDQGSTQGADIVQYEFVDPVNGGVFVIRQVSETLQESEQGSVRVPETLQESEQGSVQVSEMLQQSEQSSVQVSETLQQSEQSSVQISETLQESDQGSVQVSGTLQQSEQASVQVPETLQEAEQGDMQVSEILQRTDQGSVQVPETLQEAEQGDMQVPETLQQSEQGDMQVSETLHHSEPGTMQVSELLKHSEQSNTQVTEVLKQSQDVNIHIHLQQSEQPKGAVTSSEQSVYNNDGKLALDGEEMHTLEESEDGHVGEKEESYSTETVEQNHSNKCSNLDQSSLDVKDTSMKTSNVEYTGAETLGTTYTDKLEYPPVEQVQVLLPWLQFDSVGVSFNQLKSLLRESFNITCTLNRAKKVDLFEMSGSWDDLTIARKCITAILQNKPASLQETRNILETECNKSDRQLRTHVIEPDIIINQPKPEGTLQELVPESAIEPNIADFDVNKVKERTAQKQEDIIDKSSKAEGNVNTRKKCLDDCHVTSVNTRSSRRRYTKVGNYRDMAMGRTSSAHEKKTVKRKNSNTPDLSKTMAVTLVKEEPRDSESETIVPVEKKLKLINDNNTDSDNDDTMATNDEESIITCQVESLQRDCIEVKIPPYDEVISLKRAEPLQGEAVQTATCGQRNIQKEKQTLNHGDWATVNKTNVSQKTKKVIITKPSSLVPEITGPLVSEVTTLEGSSNTDSRTNMQFNDTSNKSDDLTLLSQSENSSTSTQPPNHISSHKSSETTISRVISEVLPDISTAEQTVSLGRLATDTGQYSTGHTTDNILETTNKQELNSDISTTGERPELLLLGLSAGGNQVCPICNHSNLASREQLLMHILTSQCIARCRKKKSTLPKELASQLDRMKKCTTTTCYMCRREFSGINQAKVHYALQMCRQKQKKNPHNIPRNETTRQYYCELCGYEAPIPYKVWQHMQRKHLHKEFPCDICNIMFTTQEFVQIHKEKVHFDQKKTVCEHCGKLMLAKYMKRHYNDVHNPNYTRSSRVRLSKLLRCSMCRYESHISGDLQRHMKRMHGERIHKCAHCTAMFSYLGDLNAHVKTIHKPREIVECPKCPKKLYPCNLAMHIRNIHDNQKDFICRVCGKALQSMFSLKYHIETHKKPSERDYKFKCLECGSGFMSKSVLRDHMNTHTGLRPYQCDMCLKAFRQRSVYHKHLEIHNNVKFMCAYCGLLFTDKEEVIEHREKVHATQYSCVCSATFNKHSLLSEHQKTCTVSRAFLSVGSVESTDGNRDQVSADKPPDFPTETSFSVLEISPNDVISPEEAAAILAQHGPQYQGKEVIKMDDGTLLVIQNESAGELEEHIQGYTLDRSAVQVKVEQPNEDEPVDIGASNTSEPIDEGASNLLSGFEDSNYQCAYCQKIFNNMEETEKHIIQNHMDNITETNGEAADTE